MTFHGSLQRFTDFPSQFVQPRHVDIWCPPGYETGTQRYPVVYMQDGQNLFDSALAYGGKTWEIDKAFSALAQARTARMAIIVGIWNTGNLRWREYMPQKPYASATSPILPSSYLERATGDPISDAYLKFLVTEVKPHVDARFRTSPAQADTFIMGSSMGGLISLYAVNSYPDVFHGAGCISTHWTAGDLALVDEIARDLPDPANHKLYFDYGTEGIDAPYEPLQLHLDEHLQARGYIKNINWVSQKFVGANHNEVDWAQRVQIPLSFLLAR